MKKLFNKVSIIFFAVLLASCSTTSILQYNDSKVPAGLSKSQVKTAIETAAKQRRWIVSEKDSNTIDAKILDTNKTVEIEIPYSTKSYSILYKNSTGMKYDATNGTIHKRYNRWVALLNTDIQQQLLTEVAKN